MGESRFLGGFAAVTGMVALGGAGLLRAQGLTNLPDPNLSGVEHIVVVMMENRSLDHFLGWMPNIDGRQAGLKYLDANARPHSTYHLRDFQGCSHPDPEHSYAGGRVEYDNGGCDGWLRAGSNDTFAIGYYRKTDLAFLGTAAPTWTSFSRYFAAIMAETFPNRLYQHAAQTDRLDNRITISTLPTIWDLLLAQGVSATYYFSDVPFLALWGEKYVAIGRPVAQFYTDALGGTLPAVSFVDPGFLSESQGASNDDHPHADIRNGEAFLARVYAAVTRGLGWANTVLVINYDEWGGFFEHVPPPTAPIPPESQAAGDTDGRLGFRVPCLVISPFARRNFVSSSQFDHCSILKMIEWRWNLSSLTVRDAGAANLGDALNFEKPNLHAPHWFVPQGPFGSICASGAAPAAQQQNEWATLAGLAASSGWNIG
jgi:phospholipase C